jgi:GGDEF domain-containing protein
VQVAGKIKLIGLEEIRAALGDRWPAAADRAMAAAEHIIRRRCGPRDTHGRTKDSGFVICFADATEDEAAFRASVIARDIRNRLIGEGGTLSGSQVSAITASIQVPDLPDQPIAEFSALIEERLQAKLAQIEGAARERLKSSIKQATCELEIVRGHDPQDVVAQFAQLPEPIERGICSAIAALPVEECKDFDLDCLLLGLATEQAARGLLDGSNHPVLVAVSFDVFHTRARTDRYIESCQKLDARLRQRLILVLSQLPYGIAKSRVMECVTRLRPFCRGVGFAVEDLDAPPIDLSAASVAIVALTADTLQRAKGAASGRFVKFIGTIHAQRARVLVRHVTSGESASRLMTLGVDLVSRAAE